MSVALNINFNRIKDTYICRKVKFQGVCTELKGNVRNFQKLK